MNLGLPAHPGHAFNQVRLRGIVKAYSRTGRGPDTMTLHVESLTADDRFVWDTIRVRIFDPANTPPHRGDWVDVRAQIRRRPHKGTWQDEEIVTEGKYMWIVPASMSKPLHTRQLVQRVLNRSQSQP